MSRESQHRGARASGVAALLFVAVALLSGCVSPYAPESFRETSPGLAYTNQHDRRAPWSFHVVRIDRSQADLALRSQHAHGAALGLGTLSEMIDDVDPAEGKPVAAVNGDFFMMPAKAHPGDPRGLQIVDGALLSAPSGGFCFWLDAAGQPHTMNVTSLFKVYWPDGTITPLGLNETRKTNGVVLFAPGAGWSTLTRNSRELLLEPIGNESWAPLTVGQTIMARVQEVRDFGNTPLRPGAMVLSIHKKWSPKVPTVKPGDVLKFSFETAPDMRGVPMALSGGPVLLREGVIQSWPKAVKDAKGRPPPPEIRTMRERHPRTAIGWNDQYYFLVVVDGRQPKLSVGMTLTELARYMKALGCREAMNLDGGGSSTMWWNNRIVNSPSDEQEERPVANALIVVRRNHTAQN